MKCLGKRDNRPSTSIKREDYLNVFVGIIWLTVFVLWKPRTKVVFNKPFRCH